MEIKLPPSLQLFPHSELRSYQTRFLRFIENNPQVLIHAPVGFGKTLMSLISTLPLVQNTGEPQYQLWIFVRTKAQIFHVFLKEISKIANSRKYGYLTAVPLIIKSDLCVKLDKIPHFYRGVCVHIRCPLLEKARSIPEEDLPAIVEQIPITSHDGDINIESFKESLSDFGCPYYVIKRCIPYSNIIVTTHTYLRNKNLQNMLFNMLASSSFTRKACIIDEAHNFTADFEAEISLNDIHKARSVIPLEVFDRLQELIQKRNGKVDRPKNLSSSAIDAFLDHQSKLSIWEKSNLLTVKDFLEARGDYWVSESEKLLQLNPFPQSTFGFVNDNFKKVILMSGTFLPINSYKILYGVSNYAHLRIPSDFQYSLNGIMYHRRFTSRYRERSTHTYKAMASVIERLHQSNPFHTVVFSTSHELKQQIHAFTSLPDTYIEKPGQSLNFMDELKEREHECIFAVIGGRLSEGVEILHPQTKRSLLTLIIIAGIPFTKPDATNLLIKNLYTQRWGINMANHLIRLPVTRGITQSIGRGIRSETDFAASLILDFRAVNLRSMLPPVRIFRNLQTMYNAYDIFFSKMRRIFNIER
jgi:Rad3-related DNA helicase